MTNIGDQVGYWQEQEERKRDKQAKVEKLIRRARSCRTFDGLEKVGDDAREAGLWYPVRTVFGECNARLRGRHTPAIYRRGDNTVTVFDDKVVGMPWIRSRQLCKEGWQYAGQATD